MIPLQEKSRGTPAHTQSAFTLLEVLISVTILTILMAAVYGTYTSNVEAVQIARFNSQINQTARIVFDRMIKDIESAIIELPVEGLELGIVGKNEEIDGMAADRIDFTSLAHIPMGRNQVRTDLCEIGYFLERDETGEGLILYRREDWSVDEDFTEGGRSFELARMISGLDIVYGDSQGETHEEWNVEGDEVGGPLLPSLVNIRLTIRDPLGREKTFTTSVHPVLTRPGPGD